MHSILLMTVVASLALAGCSSRAASTRAPAQPSASGIQTQAYDRAPATQAPSGSSKPLSETNAPDAVAARQALARASGKSVPQNSARESASVATRGEPTAPHAQVAGFQKGYQAKVRAGAALHSRPGSSSDSIQSLVLDNQVTLDSRVYNAEGYWWYVQTGSEDGWIAQSDLLQP